MTRVANRISDKASVFLLFVMITIWCIMIYYTLIPWLQGYVLLTDKTIDLSALTWAFVILYLIGSSLWFFVQVGFLLVGNKVITYQRGALVNRSRNWSEPLVSIIIPAINEEAVIKRTISNCLSQTYRNIEIVLVCHNCTDDTYSVAMQVYNNRVRAFDYKTKQAGKGIALDFGVENSRGEGVNACISRPFLGSLSSGSHHL